LEEHKSVIRQIATTDIGKSGDIARKHLGI
jgi:hypothetical protein